MGLRAGTAPGRREVGKPGPGGLELLPAFTRVPWDESQLRGGPIARPTLRKRARDNSWVPMIKEELWGLG